MFAPPTATHSLDEDSGGRPKLRQFSHLGPEGLQGACAATSILVIVRLPLVIRGRKLMPDKIDATTSTRERIISAALLLFAKQGYRATTVGEIEAAAGLTARSGALYKHFRSKRQVLEGALDRQVSAIETMGSVMDLMPLGDLRAELTLLARWTLQELAKQNDLWRILHREGGDLPELLNRVKGAVVQRSYRETAEFVRRGLGEQGHPEQDCEALAVIALGALVNYRTEEALFGEPPAGVNEDRFIKTWVDQWVAFAKGVGEQAPKEAAVDQRSSGSVHRLRPNQDGRSPRELDRG